MDAIEQRLNAIDGGRVLDVATGGGGFIATLTKSLRRYDEIIGIDRTDKRFDQGGRQFAGLPVRFMVMDAARMAFPDGSFDTVAISNSLHHLAEPSVILMEMLRVLRPGGHMIIFEMYDDNPTEKQLTHILLHRWWAEVDRRCGVSHFPTGTRESLIRLVVSLPLASFELIDFTAPVEEPLSPEVAAFLEKAFVDYLAKSKNLPDGEDLQRQGDALQRRLHEVGFAWATELFVVGVK